MRNKERKRGDVITQLSVSLSLSHTHNNTDRSIKAEKWCIVVSEVITGLSFNLWTNKDIWVHFAQFGNRALLATCTHEKTLQLQWLFPMSHYSVVPRLWAFQFSKTHNCPWKNMNYTKFMLSFTTKMYWKARKKMPWENLMFICPWVLCTRLPYQSRKVQGFTQKSIMSSQLHSEEGN